jgi:hypothetical protein
MQSLARSVLVLSLCFATLCIAPSAHADQAQDLLSLRNTVVGVLEQLVAAGMLTQEQARKIVDKAQAEALAEAQKNKAADATGPDTVRVTYVPQIVKDELRQQIGSDLKDEVTDAVVARAHDERWGVPGALPDWVTRVNFTADARLRNESVLFASDNVEGFYRNFQAINKAGGIGPAGQNALLNVSEDVQRMTGRMRFGLDSNVSDQWSMGVRVTTGSEGNPVTRNAQLGEYSGPADAFVDLAYARYRSTYVLVNGGRFLNPFLSSDVVFDDDLTFEGVAFTGLLPFEIGDAKQRGFLTVGYFPLQSVEFSSHDKYLLATQLGGQFSFAKQSVGVAVAYYDFANVTGKRNAPGSTLNDFTAPPWLQKGNTLFDIRNDTDPNTGLFALAADYKVADAMIFYDSGTIAGSSDRPIHVKVTADYAKNVGYDADDIQRRTGVDVAERTDAYKFEIAVGMPDVDAFGQWRLVAFYKHVERDAVLDAFTDDDFHRGGTDAEGWGIEALYGLSRHTWTRLRYLTANEIDGPPLGIDTVQIDLNTKF